MKLRFERWAEWSAVGEDPCIEYKDQQGAVAGP